MAISNKSTAKKTAAPAKSPAKVAAKTKKAVSAAAKPAASAKVAAKAKKAAVSNGQRRNYVEVAAYYIAERHGFTPGRELADWAAAEAEIDRLLVAGLLNS